MKAKLIIDLGAISRNWLKLDGLSSQKTETAAVIKANAYGLGAAKVGVALKKAGVKTFFVAQAEEGVELRKAVGTAPRIFNFSGLMHGDAQILDDYDVIPVLNSVEQINAFTGGRCAVQLDSGMNRLGMESADALKMRQEIHSLKPELLISHLACADEPEHFMNKTQRSNFIEISNEFSGINMSFAATGGILLGSEFHFDLTRPGIGLYGGLPFEGAEPVVQLDLPVIQIRDVKRGEFVGYGNKWQAAKNSKIATVSGGYADGIIRSAKGFHLFAGDIPCPVVGRVSMDLITVDVTKLAQVPPTLSLLNNIQTVDVLADKAGTIGYEILTSLGERYERVYTDED